MTLTRVSCNQKYPGVMKHSSICHFTESWNFLGYRFYFPYRLIDLLLPYAGFFMFEVGATFSCTQSSIFIILPRQWVLNKKKVK